MKIDAYAREVHHAEHIVPVWQALQPRYRGTFHVGTGISQRLERYGLSGVSEAPLAASPAPTLVSSSGALLGAKRAGREHLAIMEHGSGQSFGGGTNVFDQVAAQNPSYAGGNKRPAELFLHPGPHPAERDAARYPEATVKVVGSPHAESLPKREGPPGRLVAVSFHWDTMLAPETRSTFLYYRENLKSVAQDPRFEIIGHGHPRIIERLAPWYERHGIEVVRDFEEVCRRADLYVCDGVSTLYEFASTGRPVVVLNAPFYRRDIHHGLRFWEASHVGDNVWEPSDLADVIARNLDDPDRTRGNREDALNMVYGFRSGSAKRAARALEAWASKITKAG